MIVSPTPENIDRAAGKLRDGELVCFPTETVYGLGADARNPDAVRRVFAAKRRPAEHPVIVHIADASALPRWARSIPAGAKALAAAFWPGPLTLILPRASDVNDTVTGGGDSVGLRVPGHPVAQALLQRFFALGGDGVAAPSANRFGRISATTAQHVAEDFGEEIALILDGGACSHGIESTIVAFTDHEPAVLRLGAVPVENIAAVLGSAPRLPGAGAPRAPGTHASHYAPHTPPPLMAARSPVVVIAPNSFKGSMSATEAAAAIAAGVRRVWHDAELRLCPMADGGEGTLDAVLSAGGERRSARVSGAAGAPVDAAYGQIANDTAIIESAQVVGLTDPGATAYPVERRSTRGLGELIRILLDAGVKRFVAGLGGSSTNDAGAGLLSAVGLALLDGKGHSVEPTPAGLQALSRIDASAFDARLAGTCITILSDVDNPLCGKRGATAIF